MSDEPKMIFIQADTSKASNPFQAAKAAAEDAAGDAMLVSWKNNLTGEFAPNVISCKECYLDGWEMYAASRGADLRVEVNGGEYAFIFKRM